MLYMLSIGGGAFRNEIVWRIGWVSGFKTQKRGWIRNHDIILYYVKTGEAAKRFNKEYIPYKEGYVRRDGKKPTGKGIPIEDTWNCSKSDILDSIMIKSFSKEKLGYGTQKPVKLLERIIQASSNPSDIVLDPFCGCGTTIEAAKNLDRQFIGIDISSFAIDLVRDRRLKDASIPAYGIPQSLRSAEKLAREKPYDFESWAITRLPGFVPNTKQVADGGVDGRASIAHKPEDWDSKLALAQVKGGKFSLSGLRDFIHVTNRDNAALGCYVTLKPVNSTAARTEIVNQGKISVEYQKYPRMQLWSIHDYFSESLPRLPIMNDPYTGKKMLLPQLF